MARQSVRKWSNRLKESGFLPWEAQQLAKIPLTYRNPDNPKEVIPSGMKMLQAQREREWIKAGKPSVSGNKWRSHVLQMYKDRRWAYDKKGNWIYGKDGVWVQYRYWEGRCADDWELRHPGRKYPYRISPTHKDSGKDRTINKNKIEASIDRYARSHHPRNVEEEAKGYHQVAKIRKAK